MPKEEGQAQSKKREKEDDRSSHVWKANGGFDAVLLPEVREVLRCLGNKTKALSLLASLPARNSR